jgi:anti-sigma factor RsiW
MSLCNSIDTLAMAFLDDELAAEERRELELHLLDCASCRQHVDGERSDIALVRKALVAPPASALLKARIARALDAEDAEAARRERRRWSQWLLPGSAMAAAAAAILLFVGFSVPGPGSGSAMLGDVARQQTSSFPLEVHGVSTTGQLLRTLVPVEPPRFTEPGIVLIGGRLLPNGIANHDAALLQYLVTLGSEQFHLTGFVLKDVRGDEFSGGQAFQVGDQVVRIHYAAGRPIVTYVDPRYRVGYVFASEHMTAGELLRVVVSTDLIGRAPRTR